MKISLELQPCLRVKSGIGIYTYEIAKALQDINDLKKIGNVFNFKKKINSTEYLKGIDFEINTCSYLSYGIYRRLWNIIPLKYNKLFKDEVDVYHFFDYIVPPRIEGKVITTIHDLTYEFYPEIMEKKTLKRIKSGIEYSVKRADKIITISKSSKEDIMELFKINENDIEIVYPGVDYEVFSKKYTNNIFKIVKEKYNLPKNYILYMGTLEPRKNIESIVEAFKLFKEESDLKEKDFKLVIAGKKGWMFESIFKLVNKLNLQEHVIFTDYVEEKDKTIIYAMAQLFVFPSIYEGFGIPVLEAMASSVPVITSNVSSLPEVAGDAAVLVDPKDTVSIAKNMYDILSNENLKAKLINKGHIQAQKFTWEASAEKLYKIYKSMM